MTIQCYIKDHREERAASRVKYQSMSIRYQGKCMEPIEQLKGKCSFSILLLITDITIHTYRIRKWPKEELKFQGRVEGCGRSVVLLNLPQDHFLVLAIKAFGLLNIDSRQDPRQVGRLHSSHVQPVRPVIVNSVSPFVQTPGPGGRVADIEIHHHDCAGKASMQDCLKGIHVSLVLGMVGVPMLDREK